MALPAHCDDPFEFIVDDDLLFSEPLLELPHLNSHEDRSALSRGTVPALASNELSTMTETSINRGMPSVGSEAPLFEPDIALLQSEGLSVEVEMPFIDTELDTLQHAQPSEADNKLNETRWKDTEINLLLQEQHHIHQQHQELPPVSNPLQSAQQVALREQNYWAQGKEPGHCTYSSTDLRDMMNIAGQSQLVFKPFQSASVLYTDETPRGQAYYDYEYMQYMTLDPRMIEIQRSSCPQENLKGGPHHPTDQPTDLAISADAQLVKSNPSRAINKIETKGKSRKSELARKTKSLQRFANKIEAQESQFDVMSFCERAARQRTSREKQSRKAVEKAGGSCFLCKIRKTKCNGERPCEECKIFASRKSTTFAWTCNVYSKLHDLNVFQSPQDKADDLLKWTKQLYDPTTNFNNLAEMIAIVDCIEPFKIRSYCYVKKRPLSSKLDLFSYLHAIIRFKEIILRLDPGLKNRMSFCERLFRTYGTLMLEVCEAMFGDSNCATESRIAILAFMYDEIYLLKETSQGLDTQLVNHLKLAIDTRLQYLCTMFSDSNWNENFALTYFGNMDSLPPWVPNQEYPYRSMFEVITRPNMFYERIRQSVPYNVDFFDLLNKTVDGLSGISATIRDCKCCWIISCIPDAVLKLCRLPSPVMTDYSQLHISSVHQYIEYTLSSEEPVFQVKDLATENDGLENWLDFRGVILAVFHWFFSHIQDLDISRRVCLKEKISATSATYAYVAMTLVVIGVASNDASYIGTVIRKEAWTSRFGMEHIAQFCWETLDKPPFEGYYAAWLDITQQIFDQENGRPTES